LHHLRERVSKRAVSSKRRSRVLKSTGAMGPFPIRLLGPRGSRTLAWLMARHGFSELVLHGTFAETACSVKHDGPCSMIRLAPTVGVQSSARWKRRARARPRPWKPSIEAQDEWGRDYPQTFRAGPRGSPWPTLHAWASTTNEGGEAPAGSPPSWSSYTPGP